MPVPTLQDLSYIADEYARGRRKSVASGLGSAARASIATTVAPTFDAVKTVAGGVMDFGRALIAPTEEPAATPLAKPAVTPAATGAPVTTAVAANNSATSGLASLPTTQDALSGRAAVAPGQGVMRTSDGRNISFGDLKLADATAADAAPTTVRRVAPRGLTAPAPVNSIATVEPTSALGGLMASDVAMAGINRQNNQNQTSFRNSLKLQAANDDSATRGAAVARDQATTQGINLENQGKQTIADLRTALGAETDPKKRDRVANDLLLNLGKDPKENDFKVASFEDLLDPTNPMLGTRKVPVIIDKAGNTKFVTPPAGNKALPDGFSPDMVRANAEKMVKAGKLTKDAANKELQAYGLQTL